MRADGNLNNMLIEDNRVRFVDFEDCGRGHWALDVAEITEHPRSRGVSDREWVEFFESFGPEPADKQRFASARRLYAVFLFIIFLSRNHDQAEVQRERAEKLLDAPRAEQAG